MCVCVCVCVHGEDDQKARTGSSDGSEREQVATAGAAGRRGAKETVRTAEVGLDGGDMQWPDLQMEDPFDMDRPDSPPSSSRSRPRHILASADEGHQNSQSDPEDWLSQPNHPTGRIPPELRVSSSPPLVAAKVSSRRQPPPGQSNPAVFASSFPWQLDESLVSEREWATTGPASPMTPTASATRNRKRKLDQVLERAPSPALSKRKLNQVLVRAASASPTPTQTTASLGRGSTERGRASGAASTNGCVTAASVASEYSEDKATGNVEQRGAGVHSKPAGGAGSKGAYKSVVQAEGPGAAPVAPVGAASKGPGKPGAVSKGLGKPGAVSKGLGGVSKGPGAAPKEPGPPVPPQAPLGGSKGPRKQVAPVGAVSKKGIGKQVPPVGATSKKEIGKPATRGGAASKEPVKPGGVAPKGIRKPAAPVGAAPNGPHEPAGAGSQPVGAASQGPRKGGKPVVEASKGKRKPVVPAS